MELTDFGARRKKLLEQIGDCMVVVVANTEWTRSNDTHYPFRQDSQFKYLTGFSEPDSLLLLTPNHPDYKTVMFVRPKNKEQEKWVGRRLGVDDAAAILEVDKVYSNEDFEKVLPEFLKGHTGVYMNTLSHVPYSKKFLAELEKFQNSWDRNPHHTPMAIHQLNPLLGKMRLYKEPNEILMMKKAGEISGRAHRAAMAYAKPGLYEYQIQALIEFLFRHEGAEGPAYSSIVASGDNANILHYIENNSELKKGELLLIDAGCEFNTYAADISRTFPVSGKFSAEQKALYELVLETQKGIIRVAHAGKTPLELHDEACKLLTQGLIDLKILKGSVEENLEKKTFREFYCHGTGHWLGMDVHDMSSLYDEDGERIVLAPGMVFTVEPGLYIDHGSSAPEKFHGIGIRIEDDIHITENGSNENFTISVPKEVKEIEEACQVDYREFL